MKKRRNNFPCGSALQIALSVALISISAIMLALAAPSNAPKPWTQPAQAAVPKQALETKPKPAAPLALNNKVSAELNLDEQPQDDCIPFGQPGTTCVPVNAVYLPGATPQPGDTPNPAVVITKPTVGALVPVTVSDIVPAVNDRLTAFDGDFVYDSSVVTFSEILETTGTLTEGWTAAANPNRTGTASNIKTIAVQAYNAFNALDTTGGNHVLCKLRVIRVSNAGGVSTAATWGTSTNLTPFRFFFTNSDGYSGIYPNNTPPGSFSVAGLALQPFTGCNLIIYRVGDGALALSAAGAPVALSEYTPTGTFVQNFVMPPTVLGTNRRFVASGNAATEGLLTLTGNGQALVLSGYDADVGLGGITTSTTINRVIGRVAASGNINTSTALTDAASGSNPRGTASTNGTDLWFAGGTGSPRFATLGATTSTQLSTMVTNLRAINIFDGQLYVSAQSGAFRLATVGTGTPMTSGQTIVNLPGFSTSTGSPFAFFFASLPGGPSGANTLYVADDTSGSGVQKWSLVSGSWTLKNTIVGTALRGLTGTVSGATVTLYTTSGTTGTGGLFRIVDTAGYNMPNNGTLGSSLATAGANMAFRGVALAPQCGGTTPTPTPPPTATLGNYLSTSIPLSTDTTVMPDAAPTNTTRINVSTSTDFKGRLEGYPTTGVVRVTDGHPAGTYTVTVRAFDSNGASVTKTFTLTVTTPATCIPVNFAAPVNFGAGSNPVSVAVGDFNGDGKQDLAVANYVLAGTVSILLGDGAGHFSPATNFTVGSFPRSLAVGDFNGDGKQDLAVTNEGHPGGKAPATATSTPTPTPIPEDLGSVSILLGDGTGSFSGPTNFAAGTNPFSVAVGDFNGDGKQDLAVANEISNNVSILFGDGAGNFSGPSNFGAGTGPVSVVVGDFNGDGKQDLAVLSEASATVSILLGDGAGSFGAPSNFGSGIFPGSLTVGDFNSDGKQDLVLVNRQSNNVSIFLGDGAGNFSGPTILGVGNSPSSVAVGDFNGDSNQDLAVAHPSSANVSISFGDGAGNFSGPTNFGAGSNPVSVAVGDFNGDGQQDLAVADASSNNVSILLRNCLCSISGNVSYCSGTARPVPNITLNLTGAATGSAVTNNSGDYILTSIPSGGNYTVIPTPLRNLMPVVDPKPDTGDALRVQAHFQSGGTLLTGCAELAAHATGGAMVSVGDALAVAQFFNNSVGAGNLTGQWRFIPANRTYVPLTMSLTNENYDTYVMGDVTGSVVFPTPPPLGPAETMSTKASSAKAGQRELPRVVNPKPIAMVAFSAQSLASAASGESIIAVTVSNIDPSIHGRLQAFQGDLTFDSTVVSFQNPVVRRAGLTSEGNWSLAGSVLGAGKMKRLRISCFSLDGSFLSGSGTLFELRLASVSGKTGPSTSLVWSPAPNNFIFFDSNLQQQTPLGAQAGTITAPGSRNP